VTVTAIDPEATDVMLVAEGNRLRVRHTDVRREIRTGRRHEKRQRQPCDEGDTDDRGFRKGIRAAMEKLGHSCRLSLFKNVRGLLPEINVWRAWNPVRADGYTEGFSCRRRKPLRIIRKSSRLRETFHNVKTERLSACRFHTAA
jgi:hypothetical protein